MYSKNHSFPCFCSGDTLKNCNKTPNAGLTLFAPYFSSSQAVSNMHCVYANTVVQPSMQHCPYYIP